VKVVLLLALTASVSACGIAAKVDARNEYQKSLAAFKACLAAHPDDPNTACQSQKMAMEADERAYNNFGAGINPGAQRTYNVNTQAR
jgi:hypothetical protein